MSTPTLPRLRTVAAMALLLAGCAPRGADRPLPDAESAGWIDLIHGSSLEGWRNPYEWGEAWVENGEIHLRADRKFFLVTDREFSDFVFQGEVRVPDRQSNSGFMFRANVAPNRVFGYQAEVDPSDRRWSGGLYDEARRGWLHPVRGDSVSVRRFRETAGEAFDADDWNRYRIEARGDSIRIYVNDRLTTEYRDTVDASGPIAIQHHGERGKIYRFRNLRIHPLGAVR